MLHGYNQRPLTVSSPLKRREVDDLHTDVQRLAGRECCRPGGVSEVCRSSTSALCKTELAIHGHPWRAADSWRCTVTPRAWSASQGTLVQGKFYGKWNSKHFPTQRRRGCTRTGWCRAQYRLIVFMLIYFAILHDSTCIQLYTYRLNNILFSSYNMQMYLYLDCFMHFVCRRHQGLCAKTRRSWVHHRIWWRFCLQMIPRRALEAGQT